ncbi:MAG: hypothetical protein RLY93_06185 [Sumerlaeia bacterium]
MIGKIAEGRRGRILSMACEAEAIRELPAGPGCVLVSGEDFVSEDTQNTILNWIGESGRTAMVLPPFANGEFEHPVKWTVSYHTSPLKGKDPLGRILAEEVQYDLRGNLMTDHIRDLQFANGDLAVAYHRERIVEGCLVFAVLPIWSLRVLDVPDVLQSWLERIMGLGGKPAEAKPQRPAVPAIGPLHYSLLLHLYAGGYESMGEAIRAAESSQVLRLTKGQVLQLADDLAGLAYIDDARLSDKGSEALRNSPYWVYAEPLKEASNG